MRSAGSEPALISSQRALASSAMAAGKCRADQLTAARNICGAAAAVVAALGGVAQAAGAASPLTITLAALAAVGLGAVLVMYMLERRATMHNHPAGAGEGRQVPRSVPSGPMKFVNRVEELARLDELLRRAQSADGPTVAVLSGLPGAGKSAVGMHWASAVRTRFTDGDLFADFSERRRGAGTDVSGVLDDFIRMLGPSEVIVPAQLRERLDLYRALTFGRKLLILLDDVTEPGQVQQLQPAGGGSLVLATSYKQLEQLHYDGAEYVPVNPLPDDRARRLLTEMAGEQGWRFGHAPEATSQILTFCGGLALPLCVCAARLLLSQGALTVAGIAEDIADEDRRLTQLSGKGEYAGAAVFGFAYADLDPTAQLVYRRLALHPGIDLSVSHAALLAKISAAEARQQLATLAETHLLEPFEGGCYRFHGLVRLHAKEAAEREDDQTLRDEMQQRLVDWYYVAMRNADRTIVPDRLRIARDEPISVPDAPTFDSREAAFGWLEAERPNILPVLQMARDREWDQRVWQMAEALWLYYHNRRHYMDWIDATNIGIESAQSIGDKEAEGRLRAELSVPFVDLGHFDRAREELQRAERAVASSTNVRLRGSIREFTAVCYLNEGNYPHALSTFREAREMFQSIDGHRGVAIQDYNIGRVLIHMGDYSDALVALKSALKTMRAIDDRLYIGRILLRSGQAISKAGLSEDAEATLREGISVLAPLGMRLEEAESYEELATLAENSDDAIHAAEYRDCARGIYRMIGHPRAGDLVANQGSVVGATG
jgi:tetratricopeptide (TPR) repeat protein